MSGTEEPKHTSLTLSGMEENAIPKHIRIDAGDPPAALFQQRADALVKAVHIDGRANEHIVSGKVEVSGGDHGGISVQVRGLFFVQMMVDTCCQTERLVVCDNFSMNSLPNSGHVAIPCLSRASSPLLR